MRVLSKGMLLITLVFMLHGCGGEELDDNATTEGSEENLSSWDTMKWGDAKWK